MVISRRAVLTGAGAVVAAAAMPVTLSTAERYITVFNPAGPIANKVFRVSQFQEAIDYAFATKAPYIQLPGGWLPHDPC